MMIRRIAHICITAADLDNSRKFYCNVLGMKKVFDFVKDGTVSGFYLDAGDRTFIEVFRGAPSTEEGKIRHLCLETGNIDAVADALRQSGFPVTDKKKGADGSWQIWSADPDGVRIEFHQYTEKSSQLTGETAVQAEKQKKR